MRALANVLIYTALGCLAAAQAWPDDKPLTWKFWVAIAIGGGVALKALMSEGLKKKVESVVAAAVATSAAAAITDALDGDR